VQVKPHKLLRKAVWVNDDQIPSAIIGASQMRRVTFGHLFTVLPQMGMLHFPHVSLPETGTTRRLELVRRSVGAQMVEQQHHSIRYAKRPAHWTNLEVYQHGGLVLKAQPWTPELLKIKVSQTRKPWPHLSPRATRELAIRSQYRTWQHARANRCHLPLMKRSTLL
jgi:hypothetical protein